MSCENETKNKYDEAIEYLTENPGEIYGAWSYPSGKLGCLFRFLGPDDKQNANIGCPSMVKAGNYNSFENKMNEFVRKMKIPCSSLYIKPKHLPLFKLIQEEADRVYNRKV
jgi:hypothetical protein